MRDEAPAGRTAPVSAGDVTPEPPHIPNVLLRVMAVPAAALAIFIGALIWQVQQLVAHSTMLQHTDAVMLTADRILVSLLSMETGVRGYLVTGKDEFLQPYHDARDSIDGQLADLSRLIADNAAQEQRLATVRTLAAEWSNYAETVVRAKAQNTDYLDIVTAGTGMQRMDLIRAELAAFVAAEQQQRGVRAAAVRRTAGLVIGLGTVFTIVAALLFAYAARREIGALTRTYEQAWRALNQQRLRVEQARDQAEAASRAKDQFLATVSHELRNPLMPILTWAVLLRERRLDESRSQRAIEVIERSSKVLAQLIDDLLDVARIVSGKLRLDVRTVDFAPVIEAAVEAVRPAADAKQLRLQVVLDPRAGPVAGDAERLQQLVWNLLSNAVKFTPKGGRIQVTLSRLNSHLELAVADTGQGIDAALLQHVFERFWQADSGSTRRHGGLGLGLAIVRHVAELHGGSVAVHSDGANMGSTFTVKLPILARAKEVDDAGVRHPKIGEPDRDVAVPRLDGMRVLFVDDDVSSIDAISALLSSAGADVSTAQSSEQALATFGQWKPDVVLSDIEMPGEDGYGLIRRMRSFSAADGGEIPAVALTAYARVDDRIRALAAGFQMHLTKPVEPAELIAVVATLGRRTAY